MTLLHVVLSVDDLPQGCCQALCARNQSCAAFQRSEGKCLISDKAEMLHSSIATGSAAFVENHFTAIIYNISTINAQGLCLIYIFVFPLSLH